MGERCRCPTIQPLDPETVMIPEAMQDRPFPPLVGSCLPNGLDPRRPNEPPVIEFHATEPVSGEHFDGFVDTLCHEIHHAVLFDVVGEEACDALDNITGQGTYLRRREYDLEPQALLAWAEYE